LQAGFGREATTRSFNGCSKRTPTSMLQEDVTVMRCRLLREATTTRSFKRLLKKDVTAARCRRLQQKAHDARSFKGCSKRAPGVDFELWTCMLTLYLNSDFATD
jgi:hypothetical protein